MDRPHGISCTLYEGDCLSILPQLEDHSVDLVLADPPFGTTRNPWDVVIPFKALWVELWRVCRPRATVLLFADGLFAAEAMRSDPSFRYPWYWEKSKATNFLNAKHQPLRAVEQVLVYYRMPGTYNPQMREGKPYDKGVRKAQNTGAYNAFEPVHVQSKGKRYPRNLLYHATAESEGPVYHATQKPVGLLRYFVRTYTNPGEVVLDFSFGSGSTLVAAGQEGRSGIGIEKNDPNEVKRFVKQPVDLLEVAAHRLREVQVEVSCIRSNRG